MPPATGACGPRTANGAWPGGNAGVGVGAGGVVGVLGPPPGVAFNGDVT
jgi:hypothetical protein